MRAVLHPIVVASFPAVGRFQRACGVVDGKPTNTVLHVLFTLGASLGNQLFFILALPSLFWLFDVTVARRTILVWCTTYYVGQGLKDVLKLPRPSHPSVTPLETHYAAEYGLPSTHAMASIALPWFIVAASWARLSAADASALVVVATLWTSLCCASRLYMGVHSPWDVAIGAALGVAALATGCAFASDVDAWLLQHPWAPAAVVAASVVLTAAYPRPPHWVNSPGDSAIIVGVTAGVCLAARLMHDPTPPVAAITLPSAAATLRLLPYLLFGFAVLFTTRTVCKAACYGAAGAVLSSAPTPAPAPVPAATSSSVPLGKRYGVELPTKLLTYAAIGFNAVCVVPALGQTLGLA